MDNKERLVEHELLYEELDNYWNEKDIDAVTAKSLLVILVELVYPEAEPANVAIISQNDLTHGVSLKCGNVKFNLMRALNAIFAVKTTITAHGLWLVLGVLKTIALLCESIKEEFDSNEAIVLFAIYRLKNANRERVLAYIEELKNRNEYADIKNIDVDVDSALKKLEKLKSIEMVAGEYHLIETVYVKSIKNC